MLFNSYVFLLAFFPLIVLGHFWLAKCPPSAQNIWLLSSSLFFYAWWDVRFIVLLLLSIFSNYIAAMLMDHFRDKNVIRNVMFVSIILVNLLILGYFKYALFILSNLGVADSLSIGEAGILLPLGISFFTFEQIGYIVDVQRGEHAERNLVRYALFVSFFPRLVAGPILRAHELLPQLQVAHDRLRPRQRDLAIGVTLFSIGLFKKTFLADGIAPYASPVFEAAASGQQIDLVAGWLGALAYTFQLYFDFSAYSDMAIGCARCFGIRFPMNFFSPYKSLSIIEFWRRWHMTLSRFLRDYLYIPLGGSRCSLPRRYGNLLVTMLLGGLWHGANWTFIVWGSLHGLYLIVNHAWNTVRRRRPAAERARGGRLGTFAAWVTTFLAVVVAWVFFRAPSLGAALAILSGMTGQNGVVLPAVASGLVAPWETNLLALGVEFGNVSGSFVLGGVAWILSLLAIATLAPNPYQLLERWQPTLRPFEEQGSDAPAAGGRLAIGIQWQPSPFWAICAAFLAVLGFVSISRGGEFLYWQF